MVGVEEEEEEEVVVVVEMTSESEAREKSSKISGKTILYKYFTL